MEKSPELCYSSYNNNAYGIQLMCALPRGHEGPHAGLPTKYRWDWSGNVWVETDKGPVSSEQYLRDQETVMPRPSANADDDTPCGAGGTFNNDSVTCSRDHGHFGPHRAILHENRYNVFQGPNLGRPIQHKLAVIWESR